MVGGCLQTTPGKFENIGAPHQVSHRHGHTYCLKPVPTSIALCLCSSFARDARSKLDSLEQSHRSWTEVEAESLGSFIEAALRSPHGLCVTCKGFPGEVEVLAEVD